ncbi:OCIA domain-containing protein 1 [Trichomycterus rosablanca]|uniref:OCIA domain-containing protein 1 n=1 Tax=Trichomycterus rosablanca TaxID=2290929 RepID=UPI002F359EA1
MAQASSGYNPISQEPQRSSQGPLGANYIPNEEESRIFRECNRESLWYRSLPFSAIAIAVTQVMLSRGVIAPSPRFGSLPKLAMAGALGYFGGKVSYTKICQEKFKKLENSPIGDALRRAELRHMSSDKLNQPEFADPSPALPQQSGLEPEFKPTSEITSQPNPYSSYSSDYPYSSPSSSYDPAPFSSAPNEPALYSPMDDVSPQVPPYQEEGTPKKKPVLYEELRNKNRENYEVTHTQRAEPLLKPQATPKTEAVKKNKYGDAWEE